jgi:hypothetical protein
MSDFAQPYIEQAERRAEILRKLDAAMVFGTRTLPDGTSDFLLLKSEVAKILAGPPR